MKKYQYLLGLCIAALLMPVLSSCEDDSLFFRTGSMSKLAFTVSTADDNGGSASTRGVVHVVDYFVDEEGDTLYLACKIVDMDQPAAADSPATRGKYITGANLASVYGEFNVSAYREGKISRPLKETDEDGNQLTNAQSYVGVTFSARSDGSGGQQTDDNDIPVWEATSSSLDNYYWPKNESLTFYAYAPTENVEEGPSWAGLTPADNYKDDGVIEFDYTVPVSSSTPRKDAEAQPDILVSSVDKKRSDLSEYEEDTDTKYAIVPLKFYHALCAVEFKANAYTGGDNKGLLKADVTVTSVSLGNLKGSGTCTFTPSSTGSKSADFISWDFTDVTDNEGNYSQAFNYKNVTPASHIDQPLDASTDPATAFMLIPQKVGGGSSATDSDSPEASVTLGYTSTSGTAKTKTISLHGSEAYEWKAGKKYIYHLTGSLASLTLDGSLLTWGMADAPLGLRHYVLSVTGPGGSDPEITFNDPTAAQDKLFNVKSYYYEGEDDTDADERTAVTCQFEYQDENGDWQPFTPSASAEPLLDSDKGTATDYEQISAITTTTLTDDTKSDLKSDDGLDIVLTANRAAQKSGVDIQGLTNKSPLLWTEDATTASNWDLSRMGIGGVNASGTSAPTATQNTANCYIVRHPGSYVFPVVYGNGLQDGTATTSGFYNATKMENFTKANLKDKTESELEIFCNDYGDYLPAALNAYGEFINYNITWSKQGKVTDVIKQDGDVWIINDIKGNHTINGTAVNIKDDNAVKNSVKAALLWCDEENMITDVELNQGKNITSGLSPNSNKDDNNYYIRFVTADKDHLKPCNAVIVLYYESDGTAGFNPGNGEIAFWSWHIWVTDAPFSDPAITLTGTTVDGTSVADTYTFMSRDLGECDTPSKLYAMKESWRKEITIRVKQVEGDAGYQYLTVKQPDLDAPGAPNAPYYQWGRKDPFPGKTNTDPTSTDSKPIYVGVGANTMPTETDPSQSSWTVAGSKSSVTQSIAHPQHFFTDDASESTFGGRKLTNLWNMQSGLTSGTQYCSATKTIYDPCPYGYRVPTFKEMFAIAQNNKTITPTGSGQYLLSDCSRLSFSSFWNGGVLYPDVNSQDNNLVFTVLGCRDADDGGISHVGETNNETNKFNTRPSSSLDSSHNFYYMALPGDNISNSIYYTSTHDAGYPIRPIRE